MLSSLCILFCQPLSHIFRKGVSTLTYLFSSVAQQRQKPIQQLRLSKITSIQLLIRIPVVPSPKARRIEVRFGDPAANPYLCFAAMLMAGLDGIKNKIHPGEAMDKDLYDLPAEEAAEIPTVAYSLKDALEELDADREFLTAGGVFSDDFIDSYIGLKSQDVEKVNMTTHPLEFELYYSV